MGKNWAVASDLWAIRFGRMWSETLDVLLPRSCASCERGHRAVCRACASLMHRECADPFDAARAAPRWPDHVPCIAAGTYRHELARTILAFKNGSRTDTVPVLARYLARAIDALRFAPGVNLETIHGADAGPILLVPAPSSAAAFRRRGFVPASMVARAAASVAAARWSLDLRVAECLYRREPRPRWGPRMPGIATTSQKGLGSGQRAARLRGAMVVAAPPPWCWLGFRADVQGRSCILVDDVLTTGATLAEARRAITEAGGTVLGAVVLAAVRRPGRDQGPAGCDASPGADGSEPAFGDAGHIPH